MRPVTSITRWAIALAAVCAIGLTLRATPAHAQDFCVGDCNDSNSVLVNELITCVNIALEKQAVTVCPHCDANSDGHVIVNELILGVSNALKGCPGDVTPTTPPVTETPTATPTTGTTCPLEPGKYTITSLVGGKLKVASFAEFDFPAGGAIVADVMPGDGQCRHAAVVPFPGGFTAPVFCIPALGLTTSVVQRSCGIGQIASEGGADYTVQELGDTSDDAVCHNAQATCPAGGPAPDSDIRVQITVGDGTADVCTGGATVNALVAIPVDTTSWLEASSGEFCGTDDPRADGTFDPPTDALVSFFPQILDFTTDTSAARFQDLDGNGCSRSGSGPQGGFTRTGTCMDLAKLNTGQAVTTTVAVGVLGSSGSPFDIAFATTLPNKVDGPAALMGATCENPPVIDFPAQLGPAVAERCIEAGPPPGLSE